VTGFQAFQRIADLHVNSDGPAIRGRGANK